VVATDSSIKARWYIKKINNLNKNNIIINNIKNINNIPKPCHEARGRGKGRGRGRMRGRRDGV
jgi:hypothetical protein